MGLCHYISGTFTNTAPNEFEKEFITEFFTDIAWVEYIQARKRPHSLFKHIPPFDLNNIVGILNFEIMAKARESLKLLSNKLKQKERTAQAIRELKVELENDLDNAVYDGIFDKVNGFSNLYETLIKHDLVKERDD